jgi:hypothetical protein
MTFIDQVATSIHIYLALSLLWFVLLILRRSYREDRFRQNMFALRDELFDYAHSGAILFEHPAYAILRTSMNGMIRFAHRVSISHMVSVYLLKRLIGAEAITQNHQHNLEEAFNDVANLEARLRLRDIHGRMRALLVEHLVKSSLILFVVLGSLIFIAMITGATMKLWNRIWDSIPGFDFLEAEAESVGAQ